MLATPNGGQEVDFFLDYYIEYFVIQAPSRHHFSLESIMILDCGDILKGIKQQTPVIP